MPHSKKCSGSGSASNSTALLEVCWVDVPNGFPGGERGDFAEDRCIHCAEKVCAELKSSYPDHAEEISVGGNHAMTESDTPASCGDCATPLASTLRDGTEINTLEEWETADSSNVDVDASADTATPTTPKPQ